MTNNNDSGFEAWKQDKKAFGYKQETFARWFKTGRLDKKDNPSALAHLLENQSRALLNIETDQLDNDAILDIVSEFWDMLSEDHKNVMILPASLYFYQDDNGGYYSSPHVAQNHNIIAPLGDSFRDTLLGMLAERYNHLKDKTLFLYVPISSIWFDEVNSKVAISTRYAIIK